MAELIAHLLGDFFFQNQWMADGKVKSSRICAVHVLVYGLFFVALTRSPLALGVIVGTHFVIDRYRLAMRWMAFYGVACEGVLPRRLHRLIADRIAVRSGTVASERWQIAHPLPAAPPGWLAGPLAIVVDNTAHLLINHVALNYLV